MVAKIAGGGNPDFGNSGMMLVFDQLSLRLNTLLLDEGVLTEIRTAAASVLGSKTLLGNKLKDVKSIGIVGAGIQARWQLRFLALITDCRKVKITSRTNESCLRNMLKIILSICDKRDKILSMTKIHWVNADLGIWFWSNVENWNIITSRNHGLLSAYTHRSVLFQGFAGRDVAGRHGPRPCRPGGRSRTRNSRTRNKTGTRTSCGGLFYSTIDFQHI